MVGGFAFAKFQESQKRIFIIPILTQFTATTTESIPKFHMEYHIPSLAQQGWCDVYQESEGTGFTYVFYKNGLQITNATGCE